MLINLLPLISVIKKTLEGLDLQFLKSIIDPSIGMFYVLQHLDGSDNYVWILFVDYGSALNTIIPSKLSENIQNVGVLRTIHVSVYPWVSIEQTAGCENRWRLNVITYFVYWYALELRSVTNVILSFYIWLHIVSWKYQYVLMIVLCLLPTQMSLSILIRWTNLSVGAAKTIWRSM